MAHEVRFAVPKRPLAHADIEFDVFRDGGKFGELRVSKGGIVWAPKDHAYGYKLTWKMLENAAVELGRKGHL